MRHTIPRKKGEDGVPLNVAVPVSLDNELRDYMKANSVTKTAVVINGIKSQIKGESSAPRSDISFDLSDEDKRNLEKLADDVKVGDPNVFARMLVRLAIERGADTTVRFMFGQLEEKVEEQRQKGEARAGKECSVNR